MLRVSSIIFLLLFNHLLFGLPCERLTIRSEKGHLIWQAISKRNFEDHKKSLNDVEKFAKINGLHMSFSTMTERIIAGELSLLSMGEGNSNYVLTILEQMRTRSIPSSPRVFALDYAYKDPKSDRLQIVREAIQTTHREHYIAGTFQDLDNIVALRGQSFDFILSNNSLAYVLANSPKSKAKAVLDSTLLRIKPRGVLLLIGHFTDITELDPHYLFREYLNTNEHNHKIKNVLIYLSNDYFSDSFVAIELQ